MYILYGHSKSNIPNGDYRPGTYLSCMNSYNQHPDKTNTFISVLPINLMG